MNREIKFRVFFYDGKEYSTGEIIDAQSANVENYIEWDNEKLCTNDECSIIMQYIGLKDKNGKEIYEGDIIAYPMEGAKWVIDYKANFFYAKFVETNLKVYTYDLENRNYLQFEVVGNIYETPQLITD